MQISFVIPAYNEEKYIGKTIESILKNAEGHILEIIVVNNASTDNTAGIAGHYPFVKVVNETQKSLSKARQKGFEEAKAEIVAFIDADCLLSKKWCEILEKKFKNPKLVCLSGPYDYYELPLWQRRIIIKIWYLLAVVADKIIGHAADGGNMVIKKEALKKIGGFDTNINFYGDDTDTAKRLHKVGKTKFLYNFFVYTSARRFRGQGLAKTAWAYFLNYLSVTIFKKPAIRSYEDFR